MKSRAVLITSILSLIAVLAVGCGGENDRDAQAELDAAVDAALAELQSEIELPENANTKINLGTTFEAEGLSHTVNHVLDHWVNPEDVFGFETADEGFKLIALNVTVTNSGTEATEASQLYYTLDFGGAELAEHSYYGSTASNISRFESAELEPGASTTGDFLFEVPVDSTPADWTFVFSTDPFGFKKGYEATRVSLQ